MPRILIADDSPHIARVLRMKLANAGFDVSVAVNGREALAKFIEEQPHMLITDVNMPFLNGLELARWCRDLAQADLKILVITSRADREDLRSKADLKDVTFIAKPFSPREILALVRSVFAESAAGPTGTRIRVHG